MSITAGASLGIEGERRFVLYGVTWDNYEAILEIVGDRHVGVTFDGENLELMTPLPIHERYRRRIGHIIDVVATEWGIAYLGAGTTTFKRKDLERGLEPDECYYFHALDRLSNMDRIDLSVDPPPDLALEVEITSGALDKMDVYGSIGVPEIWRFDGVSLTIHLRRPDGTYREAEVGHIFPFLPGSEVAEFVLENGWPDQTKYNRAVRAWVLDVIATRSPDAAGPG